MRHRGISLARRARRAALCGVDGVHLRRLAAGDDALLRTTRLRALADAPAAFGTTLAEASARGNEFWAAQVGGMLGDRPCATWVAADAAGDGVGMLTGVEQVDWVDVIQVWVAPTQRGSGLIEALFAALFAWAPHERVDVAVAQSNGRAQAVYERLGFRVVGERPGAHEIEIEMTQQRPVSSI